MTVIVADAEAGVMVSDTQVSDGDGTLYFADKITRCANGSLAGAAGDVVACNKFLAWAKRGHKGDAPFSDDAYGLILTADGEVLVYAGSPKPDLALDGWAAIGCGAAVARGAHFARADAETCVRAAIHWNGLCGGRLQVERLPD